MLGARVAGAATVLALALGGCASAQDGDVRDVAVDFVDPGLAPDARCDLLAAATRAALESEESAACPDVIGDLPLAGGAVESVEIWGGNAQVRLSGDTVFLTETSTGWRVVAAACESRGEAPYDCEVEGP
ncbi:hypothetical protein DQ240_09140 [Blastococcus sp. TF02A-26]|nr:hypothetical protein DQ240_09140 [Blastococcus sp. TF02A-26]